MESPFISGTLEDDAYLWDAELYPLDDLPVLAISPPAQQDEIEEETAPDEPAENYLTEYGPLEHLHTLSSLLKENQRPTAADLDAALTQLTRIKEQSQRRATIFANSELSSESLDSLRDMMVAMSLSDQHEPEESSIQGGEDDLGPLAIANDFSEYTYTTLPSSLLSSHEEALLSLGLGEFDPSLPADGEGPLVADGSFDAWAASGPPRVDMDSLLDYPNLNGEWYFSPSSDPL